MKSAIALVCCLFFVALALATNINDLGQLQLGNVQRKVDLLSSIVRHNTTFTLSNSGSQPAPHFYLAVESEAEAHLAFIRVTDVDARVDFVVDTSSGEQLDVASGLRYHLHKVHLTKPLQSKGTLNLNVLYVFTHVLRPFPEKISQGEPQLVVYEQSGSHFFLSPYPSQSQKTVVKLPSGKTESHSEHPPTSVKGDTITYGPYQDLPALSFSAMRLHFPTRQPFLTATSLTRLVEVSHWGNINIEEHYDSLRNEGAQLEGPYSRLDVMMHRSLVSNSADRFGLVLPRVAHDLYYRDEIGNISTSTVRVEDGNLIFDITPRFPLAGGWKTKFYLGYDLPLEQFVRKEEQTGKIVLEVGFGRKFSGVDVVVDDLTIRVILPEGAKDIEVTTPFSIDDQSTAIHKTYLDTAGRTVVILHKRNVVAEHDQAFQVRYSFATTSMLQEPLLLVAAYFAAFLLAILYLRFHLSISPSSSSSSSSAIQDLLYHWKDLHEQRVKLHDHFVVTSDEKGRAAIEAELARVDRETQQVLPSLLTQVAGNKAIAETIRATEEKQSKLAEMLNVNASSKKKRIGGASEPQRKRFAEGYHACDEETGNVIDDAIRHFESVDG
ncbi:proteasome regulatory particle base subunit [Balamuthia mandrillaris]